MNAAEVIKCFRGVRPMARTLNIPPSTVQRWKNTGVIPWPYHDEVVRLARENRIDLIRSDLESMIPVKRLG